jgi:hypothetical protein
LLKAEKNLEKNYADGKFSELIASFTVYPTMPVERQGELKASTQHPHPLHRYSAQPRE